MNDKKQRKNKIKTGNHYNSYQFYVGLYNFGFESDGSSSNSSVILVAALFREYIELLAFASTFSDLMASSRLLIISCLISFSRK